MYLRGGNLRKNPEAPVIDWSGRSARGYRVFGSLLQVQVALAHILLAIESIPL